MAAGASEQGLCTVPSLTLIGRVGAWQVYETIVDADCPQQEEFEIVRCVGHQHIGARCITLFNAETNEKICQSCPVYGKKEGARALLR